MSPLRTETGGAKHRAPHMGRLLQTVLSRIALPSGILALTLILPSYMFHRPLRIRARGLGPDAWPTIFLNAIAVIAVLWIITELWGVFAEQKRKRTAFVPEQTEVYSYRKAAGGMALLLGFAWLLPNVGFAISAALFIFCWCLLGGIRKSGILLAVSVIGMITLLWVFMGLALMPLNRGVGVFDDFSVWFLRLLRIY
jgi:putative tricarboxylic transport membrane protein